MGSVSCNCVHSCKTAGSAVGELGTCTMMQGGEHEHPMTAGHSCVKLSIKCDCLLAFDLISCLNRSPHSGRKKGMGKPPHASPMLKHN